MSKQKNLFYGKRGEDKAADFLAKNGYKILARNFRTRLGEIDIIAKDKDTLVFIEVKSRNSTRFGLPSEALSKFKQGQIAKTAVLFLKQNNLCDKKARFDFVSVLYLPNGEEKLDLIKNAFELDGRFSY